MSVTQALLRRVTVNSLQQIGNQDGCLPDRHAPRAIAMQRTELRDSDLESSDADIPTPPTLKLSILPSNLVRHATSLQVTRSVQRPGADHDATTKRMRRFGTER